MKLRLALSAHDVSDACLIDSAEITQDSREAISTAQISVYQKFGVARYDAAIYSQAAYRYEWEAREWQPVQLWDADTGQVLFAGLVLSIQRRQMGPHVRYEMSCSDWGILLERKLITQSWPSGTFDATIVTDVINQVPGLSIGTVIPQITLGAMEAKDYRARDLLDDVCELTGAEWNVSYNGAVNYYRQGSIVAPFELTDRRPLTPVQAHYILDDYSSDFTDAANRVLVLGAIGETGEIRAQADNGSSQLQYGLLSTTLVDRNLASQETADVWASTEVAVRAFPKATVVVSLFEPGLARGMTVNIESVKYGLSAAMILRSLKIVVAAPDRQRAGGPGHVLKYTATLGWRPPDSIYMLRRMQRKPVDSTIAPATPVPPGSITGEDFAAGISPVYIVGGKPTDWSQYPQDAVFLNTADRKLYRRIAGNDWTAVVPAADILGQLGTSQLAPGSVTTTILADGSVVTAKIPAGAIQGPQIAAQAVTANAIAANAVYAEALQANSVRSIALAAESVTAGKIAALGVIAGNIAADAVVAGTIAAGAVRAGNLAAGAVTAGTIAAGAIRAQDAVFATGAIVDADIANLNGGKIKANSITSDKLSAIELAVGFGGDKPGRVTVYNTVGGAVASLGDLGTVGGAGQFGSWAKVGGFGGDGYFNAVVKTDVSGNLFINQANFTITGVDGSLVQTSPTTFDPTYGSIAINVSKQGEAATALVSRGLVIRDRFGTNIGAFVRDPSHESAVQLALPVPGSRLILLDGFTGVTRSDGGFGVSGSVGQTENVVTGGVTLRFVGGIYVGH